MRRGGRGTKRAAANATAKSALLARALDEGDLILLPELGQTEVRQGLSSKTDAKRVAELLTAMQLPPELEEHD